MGAPANAARIALKALIIQKKAGLTDEETVLPIRENPHRQYFIGYERYQDKELFHLTMMVYF
jgi:hypothetical protein